MEIKNILKIKDGCTGCGGCAIICPVKSIKMKRNENGFYKPEINDKCTQCGLCTKVCYKFINEQKNTININNSNSFLAYSLDDDIRYRASSGGIGEELCRYALENGYKVCGVIYDYEKNIAKHIITDDLSDIKKIVGSKYIQSYTEECFKDLRKDEKYIIIGTPCQIYALRKYMQIMKIESWILVDFFCHGTPSMNLWDKYLDKIITDKRIKNISNINFRDKISGWHKFSITIEGNGEKYSSNLDDDYFMNSFLRNLDLQEACYTCKLRFDKIFSDIRLGDFWGRKCESDEKGISIILTNTELGEKIFSDLKGIYCCKVTEEELRESQYVEKIAIPKDKDEFQGLLMSKVHMDDIYRKIILPNKKREERKRLIRYPFRIIKKVIKKVIKN